VKTNNSSDGDDDDAANVHEQKQTIALKINKLLTDNMMKKLFDRLFANICEHKMCKIVVKTLSVRKEK